jgi:hypothetical protein
MHIPTACVLPCDLLAVQEQWVFRMKVGGGVRITDDNLPKTAAVAAGRFGQVTPASGSGGED